MIAAYSHLAVTVTRMEPMAGFYCAVFGFQASPHVFEGHGHRLARVMGVDQATIRGRFLRHDGLLLELLEYESAHRRAPLPRPDDEIGYCHLSFVVGDLDETAQRIAAHGGEYHAATRTEFVFDGGGVTTMAFCLDPEGNRIELIHHHDLPSRAAHARFLGVERMAWLTGTGS